MPKKIGFCYSYDFFANGFETHRFKLNENFGVFIMLHKLKVESLPNSMICHFFCKKTAFNYMGKHFKEFTCFLLRN